MLITYGLMMLENYLATLKREEGQGMAEYGLILALVALAVILAFTFLGTQVSTLISSVGSNLTVP
jgi:pilus assembly protein Flp/PilA